VGRHTHFKIYNGETHFNIQNRGHAIQNLKWRDALQYLNGETYTSKVNVARHTHFKICNGETHFNIQNGRHTLQNLKLRDALQYLNGETYTSKFNVGRHTSKFVMERQTSIFKTGDTHFRI